MELFIEWALLYKKSINISWKVEIIIIDINVKKQKLSDPTVKLFLGLFINLYKYLYEIIIKYAFDFALWFLV